MKYKIIDMQGAYVHIDEEFKTKEEVRQHLINYHSIDWDDEVDINNLTLKEICDYGDWDIEEEKS